jgi:hypothetical protein
MTKKKQKKEWCNGAIGVLFSFLPTPIKGVLCVHERDCTSRNRLSIQQLHQLIPIHEFYPYLLNFHVIRSTTTTTTPDECPWRVSHVAYIEYLARLLKAQSCCNDAIESLQQSLTFSSGRGRGEEFDFVVFDGHSESIGCGKE